MTTPFFRPCPFCGTWFLRFDCEGEMRALVCMGCGASTDYKPDGKDIEFWNQRAYDSEFESLKAERDALLKWQQERKDYKAECIELRARVAELEEFKEECNQEGMDRDLCD